MWTCPKCRAEVDDGFEVCWQCGRAIDGAEDPAFNPDAEGIIGEADFEAERAERTNENLVTIATFVEMPPAHAMRMRLEAEGIRAAVDGDFSILNNPWVPGFLGAPIRVQVFESDVEHAREVLAGFQHEEGDDAEEGDDEA
jgi:hypothetical protein